MFIGSVRSPLMDYDPEDSGWCTVSMLSARPSSCIWAPVRWVAPRDRLGPSH